MANIEKGLKRIERVLLVFGIVGVVVILSVSAYKIIEGAKFITDVWAYIAFLISMCFSPYLVYKIISWIVMEFVDEVKE